MALPLLAAGLAGLGRVGVGIAARQAGKKGLQQTIANASRAAANPVAKPTAREGALGALGAAGTGMGALATGAAMDRGDYGSALVNGVGTMLGGANMVGNVARTATGASRLAAGTATGSTGLFNSTPLADSAARGIANIMSPAQAGTVPQPVAQTAQPITATTPAATGTQPAAQTDPASTKRAEMLAAQDANRTANIDRWGNVAGQNYQDITNDLRKLADQGPKQWDTSLRDMSEWEADNRRREIRMAYQNHPIPGKGEGKVLEFDNDLQKRREAIENSRINGYGQNVSAFDKSLAALGQANGQSVDMADKMFGQTATRRGQDIAAQKNLWDAQANDKSATAQLLTALGGLGGKGGKGGKGDSPYKSEKERLDYLKSLAETQYPDNPQGQKKLIDSVLLNSENGKAWDTLMQDGMPNVANELLTSMTDQTTYTPEQLAGATRSRFNLLDQLKGQWDDLGDSKKDNTTWFEPRYTIPGRSDSVNERTLANLKNQSVTDLVKQAVLNPTQQVNGMPFTYADFGGDEAAFQRAVMAHFQAAHNTASQEKGR